MKTAFDIMERINTLNEYLGGVNSGRSAISTWNEEFGEGNPNAVALTSLAKEIQREKEELEKKLRSISA